MYYDPNNIFAKIIRGEVLCKKVHEDKHTLAFYDTNPQAPVHILVIPKGTYIDTSDFVSRASDIEIFALHRAVAQVVLKTGISQSGYRITCNTGINGGQEVPHMHWHVLGGCYLGSMVSATHLNSERKV